MAADRSFAMPRRRESIRDLRFGRAAVDSQRMNAAGERRARMRADQGGLLAAAFACAPTGIAIGDYEGRILDCNDRFLRICGRTEDELLGSPFSVLLHPDEAEGATISFRRFTRGQEDEYDAHRRYVRPDDSEVLVRVLVRADRSVSPPRAIVVVEDVSDDCKLLAAISRREDRFRALIENASELITVTTPEGQILYQSPSVTRMLGWTPEELADKPPLDVMHPDDRERWGLAFAQLLLDGKPVTTTYRVRHKDGRWRQLEATSSNLLDDPSIGGIVINSRDVTDSHLAQEQLREAEERYRTLVEQLPLVVYTTSAEPGGEIVYISPQVEELLGYPLDDWRAGRGLWERALHPDDRERVISEIAEQRGKSERIRVEYRMLTKTGQTVWVIDDMALLRDADGQPRVYQGFVLDITARETLQERLRHSQRLEAIGSLASGIAHDFNNLLMGVMGYTTLAIKSNAQGDTAQVEQHLERVRAAADRAKSLTHQLLAFGRKQLLREEVLDVASAITETAELLGRVIGDDIELVVEIDPGAGAVNVDPAQFEQLLMNLAINARDAMPAGGTLTISAGKRKIRRGEQLPRGRYVSIIVSDTGTGMEQATQERLFEPFFTTKPKGQGTGLGLASAHGFVSQSGGEIRVSSTLGVGTCFEILLPQVEAANQSLEPGASVDVVAEEDSLTATILLVEDDEMVCNLVGRMLTLDGHTVHAFADSDDALASVEGTRFDALITDVVMPNTSGVVLAQEIRRRCTDTKVLLMSGYSGERLDGDVLTDPHVAFIQKPFSPDELASAVDELLRR
jgi:PAS domain S-box-containing protein